MGRIKGGGLNDPRQQGGFRKGHLGRVFSKINLRSRLNAVGPGAEVDSIEIGLQNFVLGHLFFQLQGQIRLLGLAGQGLFAGLINC